MLVGLFSPLAQIHARTLTQAEQQQITSQQAILDSTKAEYVSLGNASGGTAAQQKARTQRYNELQTIRDAATAKINYIQNMAKKDLRPETIQQNLNPKSATPAPTPAITPSNTNYQLLAPLPDPNKSNELVREFDTAGGLGKYLNQIIKIFIGLAAVLSVVMIVVGGLEYMTSELPGLKSEGKERIIHAILGLLIALGAYALLFTINPDLLKSDVDKKIAPTTVTPPATAKPAVTTPSLQPVVSPPVIP